MNKLFLTLMLSSLSLLLQANDSSLIYQKHSSCHCHEHDSIEVALEYKSPKSACKHSSFGIYVSLLSINTEAVNTDRELFHFVEGRKKKALFKFHVQPNETIVTFIVSFDHNFTDFSADNVGTLKACVNGQLIPITLNEYESNIAIGVLNISQ